MRARGGESPAATGFADRMCLAIYGAPGSGAPLDFSLNFAPPIGLGESRRGAGGGGLRGAQGCDEGEQGEETPRRAAPRGFLLLVGFGVEPEPSAVRLHLSLFAGLALLLFLADRP